MKQIEREIKAALTKDQYESLLDRHKCVGQKTFYNMYYDTPCFDLKADHKMLRLRLSADLSSGVLTFKMPAQESQVGVQACVECEDALNAEQTRHMMLNPTSFVSDHRDTLDSCKAVAPFVGASELDNKGGFANTRTYLLNPYGPGTWEVDCFVIDDETYYQFECELLDGVEFGLMLDGVVQAGIPLDQDAPKKSKMFFNTLPGLV